MTISVGRGIICLVFSTIPTICTSLTPTIATLRGGSGNCSASWVGALGDGGGGREAGLNLNPAAAGGVKTNCYHLLPLPYNISTRSVEGTVGE